MAEITSLTTVSKTDININDWFVVANKSTKKARKLQVKSMLPSVNTVGSLSESLYTSVTHGNQINLKGLKSADSTKLTVTTADNNLILTLVESGIDLNKCNNLNSGFLSSVDLSRAKNVLSASYGGTGLNTITKGCVLYSSAANTIATRQLNTNGQLLIGNSSLGVPVLGNITSSDASITVTNGAGSIDLAVASSALLKSTLQTDKYNINLNAAASTNF